MATTYYSDIDFKFRKISSTGDLNKVTNVDAINQSLLSLFNTTKKERAFNPEYGTNLKNLLFEPLDTITANNILEDIQHSILLWEDGRIQLTELNVNINHDRGQYEIDLAYLIRNTTKSGRLELVLKKI